MHVTGLILTSSLALAANAVPYHGHGKHHMAHEKRDDTFKIHVLNNCADDKSFALYQIDASFNMAEMSTPKTIAAGMASAIDAPYTALGMRLSATADQGADAQWDPQALFEFGYSEYAGQPGTAYDLSVMEGSPPGIGVAVYPHQSECPTKVCSPEDCAPGQGWTNPDQVNAGSPGDTVCYYGKTNFRVVWCP